VSACPHDKPKRLKLKSLTWHRDSPSRVLAHQLVLGQKVKGQGRKVTKCKRRSSGRRELCTLSSTQSLVITIIVGLLTLFVLLLVTAQHNVRLFCMFMTGICQLIERLSPWRATQLIVNVTHTVQYRLDHRSI